jgi:hypothetical protein
VDDTGRITREVKVASEPDALLAVLRNPAYRFKRRRKMEDQRRTVAEKEVAARRATDAQMFEDAERLIAAWNERQAKRM